MVARILIVDDNQINLLAMKKILSKLELEIDLVSSGKEALEFAKHNDYCVILLDVQMPEMNGFQVAEQLSLMKKEYPIPIIFVTGINKEEQFIFKGYEMGAVDYLFRPVESDILRSKVKVFMDLQKEKNNAKRLIEELKHSLETEKRLQTKLIQDSKMAALGILASGVAHEINNPLAIIVGQVNNLEKRILRLPDNPNSEELAGFLEFLKSRLVKVAATSHRIAKVIKGMNDFTGDLHKRKAENDTSEIKDIQFKIKSFSEEKLKGRGIDVDINDIDFEQFIVGNGSQVALVILGLIQNSSDAISGAKGAWIKVEFEHVSEKIFAIKVTDSGSGIDKDIISQIFDPFFTSKDPGMGTGLGLGVSKRIIKDFGGDLFYNESSKHTQFVTHLKKN